MSQLHAKWKLPIVLLAFVVPGCFVPQIKQEEYPACQTWTKELKLELSSMGEGNALVDGLASGLVSCTRPECLLGIPIALVTIPATSFIVSGSIVAVGDTIHWIEKQGRCPFVESK